MLPATRTRTFITASLAKGTRPEPDISNQDFLGSYLDYSCWIRMISARQQLTVLEGDTSDIDKLAALATFYQLAGIVVEDALSMYIAWSMWNEDKTQAIPDILERISLRLSEPSTPLPDHYASEIKQKYLTTKKRIDIYARDYLIQILKVDDDMLPQQFGIAWKRNPSVKLIPKKLLPFWNTLGNFLRECLLPLVNPKGALLAACYNKMKHGPQISIASATNAAKSRGVSEEALEGHGSAVSIRLLLRGARTQETDEEFRDQVRAAPFLPLDAPNARRWFFQHIVQTSNSLFISGTLLHNSNRIGNNRSLAVPEGRVRSIVQEHGTHIESTFGVP